MPEYLAPAVYVEEVDTGSKPIEGVSTSTTGMVGVTERGPLNVPILVTSKGEYWRWFGQTLDPVDFGPHCFLPHAVDGFFTNGGKRLYVTRIIDTTLATPAGFSLFYDGAAGPADTVLLRASAELTGSAINPPPLVALSGNNLNVNDWVRVGDGSAAEYRQVTTIAAETVVVPLHLPFARAHGNGANLRQFSLGGVAAQFNLSRAVLPGAAILDVEGATADINALAQGHLLRIDGALGEFRFVQGVTNVADAAAGRRTARVTLDAPLALPHAGIMPTLLNNVERFAIPVPPPNAVQLAPASAGGASVVFVNNRGGAFNTRTDLVVVDEGDVQAREVRRIGELHSATLASGVPLGCEAGSVISEVVLSTSKTIQTTAAPPPTPAVFGVNDVSNIAPGQRLEVAGTACTVSLVVPGVAPAGVITVAPALGAAPGNGTPVVLLGSSPIIQVTAAPAPTVTAFGVNDISSLATAQRVLVNGVPRTISSIVPAATAPAGVVTVTPALGAAPAAGNVVVPVRQLQAPGATGGSTFLRLDNRLGLKAGDVLRITSGALEEFVTIDALPNQAAPGVKPDAGTVLLAQPLTRDYDAASTDVVDLLPPTAGALQSTAAVLDVPAGGTTLLLADGSGYTPIALPGGRFVSVRTPEGEVSYHRISALAATATPMMVELNLTLDRAHGMGSPLVERVRLLDAEALDVGAWGNRLRLSVAAETTPLASTTLSAVVVMPTQVRLASLTGVEPGSVLEMRDGTGAPVGGLLKVQAVDRTNGIVTLQGAGLDFAQQATWAALPPGASLALVSREFQLRIELLRQPDALFPARNKTVIQQEDFRGLSMDPRHSHYAPRLVGMIGGPLRRSDRRPEGDSELVRLRDASSVAATQQSIRVGPEFLTDVLPDGRIDRARHALSGGNDSIGTLGDDAYVGDDDPNPELRTGLQTLRNVEEISILAAPGNTSIGVQNALINHCELMRYRFAVLDGNPPPNDAMANIQAQRQQFDTKYAALYHPWLLIPDPYPLSTGTVPDYPIPPSGHMLGIYARTDIDRGVHKAPANEVVRGVTGLQRLLNKEQQDILNPYPVNINVIRDFRPNNRGIRVYGGRCITSDSDWKYVNVRRLLIFIEASIDRGLQWVVFEPNAEPLWARVRRSITNFLTLVWRNGALEGTKVEEAFFVKCDRTTMTQTDIDQGRLICLVGVAPVKPAEFVIVRIGLWTAHADD